MALLTCCDLSIGYEGKVIADRINFSAEKGNYICIVGENGSGKSTLIKTILKLNTPISGKIKMGDGLKMNEIGYLPQQTEIQKDFPASVSEVVMSGFLGRHKIFPFYTKAERLKAQQEMERLDITPIAKRCYRELSGGQQQRTFLARALCAAQKMLLLDEPVSGLDLKVTAKMYDLIADLNKKEEMTVIMVSHDVKTAIRYATHILHLGNTQLFFGTTNEYLKSKPGMEFLF